MEIINPCSQFLCSLGVNEIPNKTFILDSHRPFICSVVVICLTKNSQTSVSQTSTKDISESFVNSAIRINIAIHSLVGVVRKTNTLRSHLFANIVVKISIFSFLLCKLKHFLLQLYI